MKLFLSKVVRASVSHSKFLLPLTLLFFIFVFTSQKFENSKGIPTHSKLTIEKAKELFSRTGVRNFEVDSRGGEEENDSTYAIYMTLGWNNASEYHDGTNNLDVIELPILHSNLLKTFNVASTVDDSNGYPNNGQKENLLVTQDTNGVVNFTILKISGTTDYLATHDMQVNSFKSLDSGFKGLAQYYNLKDSLLIGYLFNAGNIYKVEAYNEEGYHESEVQDRWQFCIVGWITAKTCTGPKNHTCDQRSQCDCAGIHCDPPVCIALLDICGGPTPSGGSWPPPPPPPGNEGNGVGNGGINTGNCQCMHNIADAPNSVFIVTPQLDYGFLCSYYVDYKLLGTNCKNGNFASGVITLRQFLIYENCHEVTYSVSMNYPPTMDVKTQLGPCHWSTNVEFNATILWKAVWWLGPIPFPTQYSYDVYDTVPFDIN